MKQETRKAFANCILNIALKENLCEAQRQQLCNEPLFNPYNVFMRVSYHSNQILVPQLLRYTKEKSIACTFREATRLIQYFGRAGKLEYSDFMQIILPTCNATLRTYASQKDVKFSQKLGASLEYSLQQLITKELEYHRFAESYSHQVVQWKDFTVEKIFTEMHKKIIAHIEIEDISLFLESIKIIPNLPEIMAFVRRVDQDADGKLGYNELCDLFSPHKSKMLLTSLINQTKSPSPYKLSIQSESELLAYSEPKAANRDSVSLKEDLSYMAEIFRQQICAGKELEATRETLCLKSDFNLKDAFNLFDAGNIGIITHDGLKNTLLKMEVAASYKDIKLLQYYYGDNTHDYFTYDCFCKLIIPNQKEYNQLLQSRVSLNKEFTESTKLALRLLFLTILRIGYDNESMIDKLNKLKLGLIFNRISNNSEVITKLRLSQFMEGMKYTLLDKDIQYIIDMYDRDCDGVISSKDFISALKQYGE